MLFDLQKSELPEKVSEAYSSLDSDQKKAISLIVEQGYTQSRIADELNISQPTISRWMNGERHLDFQEVLEYRQKELYEGNVDSVKGSVNIAFEVVTRFLEQMNVRNPEQKDFNNAIDILSRFGLVDAIQKEISDQMGHEDEKERDVEIVLHQYFGQDLSKEELEKIKQIFGQIGQMDGSQLGDISKALSEYRDEKKLGVLNDEEEVEFTVN